MTRAPDGTRAGTGRDDGTWGVRALPAREADLLARHLRTDPGANAFLLGWLENYGVGDGDAFAFLGAYTRGRLIGRELACAALVAEGDICCISAGPAPAAAAMAAHLAAGSYTFRTLAGPEANVAPLLARELGDGEPTVLRQRVYVLEPASLRLASAPALRPALPEDVPALIDAGLHMHAEELGAPLSAWRTDAFRRSVAIKVDQGRSWVLTDPYDGRLVFKASTSAAAREVVQLEGIWVAPDVRGRGLGFACVSELCRRLFELHRLVSLYVGVDNHAALALYTRLGFRAGTPFTSALFDPRS